MGANYTAELRFRTRERTTGRGQAASIYNVVRLKADTTY